MAKTIKPDITGTVANTTEVASGMRERTRSNASNIRNLLNRLYGWVWPASLFASGVALGLALQRSNSVFTNGFVNATIIAIIVSLLSIDILYALAVWREVRKRKRLYH